MEFLTGVNERGYGTPRKKGKPLSKKLVHRELLASSNIKIVVSGPDHIGCTTLLQLLGKQLGVATANAPRLTPSERVEFNQAYFDGQV